MERDVKFRAVAREGLYFRAGRVLFTGIMMLSSGMAFGQNSVTVPSQMEDMATGIYNVFTSAFLKTVIAIIFCGAVVAYIYNKDNEKMRGKLIAIMIGTALLMSSMVVVEMIFKVGGYGSS